MSKLTAKQRERLPAKVFGLPERARTKQARRETGNYPMPDRGHAISAIRLSELERQRGNLTKDEYERINRKARKVLKKNTSKKTAPAKQKAAKKKRTKGAQKKT